jgi:cyclopropane fatty-acyl-phospholipid synthase-like methyltransferase
MLDAENLRRHYVRSLGFWLDRFERNSDRLLSTWESMHFGSGLLGGRNSCS